jgi:hypothetical protein
VSGSAAGGAAAWVQAASALLLLAVAGHCAARLVQAGRAAARPAAAHHAADLLMALGLAAMLWPAGDPVPPPAGEVAFGLVAAGSLLGALHAREAGRRLDWAQRAVGGAAMVSMFAGASGPVTWVLIAYLVSFAAWSALATALGLAPGARRVAAAAGPARTLPGLVLAPPAVSTCHAVMAIAMAYLLLAMR